jgi:D-lyxose ketol-isomerase
MKRSEINAVLREADAMLARFGQALPPFACWTADELRARLPDWPGVLEGRLGWDVTDYGRGDFAGLGLTLFTARNGRAADLAAGRGMLYAEKWLISRRDQLSPMHRHVVKAEDIIVRGGARMAVKLHASAPDGAIDETAPVVLRTDGRERRCAAGETLTFGPGESITLMPGVWHAFWGEGGDVLLGEVSTVNDDLTDNVFAEPLPRFPAVEEDEAPWRWCVADYQKLAVR